MNISLLLILILPQKISAFLHPSPFILQSQSLQGHDVRFKFIKTKISDFTPKYQQTKLELSSLSLPLIQKDDTWGNIAAICATASISHKIGQTTAIGRLLGPPVTAMAIAFVLGSIGVLPAGMF